MSLFAPHPLLDMTSADVPANAHETLGFELGWDHARCGVMPSPAQSFEASSLRSGWAVGHTTNSSRPRVAPRSVQLWLHLRLQAWVLGQRVEPVQVTPRYLEQLEVSHCPITRMPLDASSLLNHEGVFARVRHDAAYVAGNIAVLGARAERARQGLGRERAAELGKSLGSGSSSGLGGLTAPQWKRMAALGSFVEPLTHAQACEQPLLVLPPNRLRLLNAAQALERLPAGNSSPLAGAFASAVSRPCCWPKRRSAHSRHSFSCPVATGSGGGPKLAPHELRWAIEDAWRSPLVQQRWQAFAHTLVPGDVNHWSCVPTPNARGRGRCLRLAFSLWRGQPRCRAIGIAVLDPSLTPPVQRRRHGSGIWRGGGAGSA